MSEAKPTFQEILRKLTLFWEKQGCIIHQGYDLEVGAGTFNPATFLRALGPEPYNAAYIEPSRRPTDGRYGTNPNRLQHYFQFQVVLKPSPLNIQDLYLESLEAIGFNLKDHDIRFVHDDWESPTLGAWGLGWEVWMDGMECAQFTYFQSIGGVHLQPIMGEITYGIERQAMYLQQVNSIFDLQWNDKLTYGDIYHRSEVEWSHYNFEKASTDMWFRHFDDYEREANSLIAQNLPLPAYDFVLKASHAFNMLDARGVISVTERTGYITRIRNLACQIAQAYTKSREELGHPLLAKNACLEKKEIVLPAMSESLLHQPEGKTETFLLEIGCEELPAAFVTIGAQNLEKAIKNLLQKEGIPYQAIHSYGTPRRLAVSVEGLAYGKPAAKQEKKGPPIEQFYDQDGKLKPAGEGFFRSLQMEPVSLEAIRSGEAKNIFLKQIKNVDYLFAAIEIPGKATAQILAEQLPNIILSLDFPKKMRWSDLDITFARPLRWVVALFGTEVVPFQLGNLQSGRESRGHRQLCNRPFSIAHAGEYLKSCRDHYVLADFNERGESIVSQLKEIESSIGNKIVSRERVIPQVLNLVEYPFLTTASFDQSYLKAPKEVLISEMVENQKYFPIEDANGNLVNRFVITANTEPTEQIRKGNEKVISPRLADGVFLYQQDLKTSLEELNAKLKQMTFQKELGTVFDKVARMEMHALALQRTLKISTLEKAARAAYLCKADLASKMVYEFPELQGIMGRYYALASGEDPEVADAIEEHWMPRGENAPLPTTKTGIIVSLADKVDNLLGCFSVGLKPSSSSDPYALRRQSLGMIKLLIQGKYRVNLKKLMLECATHFPEELQKNREETVQEIFSFLANRIRTVYQDYGFRPDEIEASLSYGFSDIYDLFCRVQALHEFRKSSGKSFDLLYEVFKRAKGQLNGHAVLSFEKDLLQENAEKQLFSLLESSEGKFVEVLQRGEYDQAYRMIADIQPALDTLFNEVKILAENRDLQNNRLALLQKVQDRFSKLLDFSKIQDLKEREA